MPFFSFDSADELLFVCFFLLQVTPSSHRYLKEIEIREEGGTPAIIGSIRAGLAMQLKEAVGCEEILVREQLLLSRVLSKWRDVQEVNKIYHVL